MNLYRSGWTHVSKKDLPQKLSLIDISPFFVTAVSAHNTVYRFDRVLRNWRVLDRKFTAKYNEEGLTNARSKRSDTMGA